MKKIMKMLLLAAIFTLALSVSAFAAGAGSDAGICDVDIEAEFASTVTVTPKTADGDTATKNESNVYVDAERVTVTFSGAKASKYYLVVALDDDNQYPTVGDDGKNTVAYINQETASSTSVSFDVYPKSLVSGQTYNVYVSSNDGTNSYKTVASFSYYAPYVLGNVDLSVDKRITTIDAMMTLQMAIGLTPDKWTDIQWLAANVDLSNTAENHGVTTIDAMMILQKAIGKVPSPF